MLGPIVSGFVSPAFGWRWSFWVALIFAGVTMIFVSLFPETYQPTLVKIHSPKHMPESRIEDSEPSKHRNRQWGSIIRRVLLRPLHLLFTEPILAACSMYLALCYSIFYVSFTVFPYIFQKVFSLSPGQCGLVQLTIGAGCALSLPIYWAYERILPTLVDISSAPNKQELRRLPLACLGSPLFVISLFWLGWSSRDDVSFAVPMMAGIPFGIGFMCVFTAILYFSLFLIKSVKYMLIKN